jgi:hypothetical protein
MAHGVLWGPPTTESDPKATTMTDLVILALTAAMFALAVGFVRLCDRV